MRRVLTVAVAVATTLALTGCLKVDMDLEVHEDSMVSGEMTLAVSKAMKEMMEGFAEEFGDEADSDTDGLDGEFFESDDVPEGATVEPYEDDKFIGQTMTFEKVSIDQVNESATDEDSDAWTITKEGDNFVFEAVGDFANEDAEEAQEDPMGLGLEQMFADAELRIAVTFPGDVLESNGEVDGRTVVWTPEFGETLTMRAVAEAEGNSVVPGFLDPTSSEGNGNTGLLVAIGGLVLILLLALGGLFVVRRRQTVGN